MDRHIYIYSYDCAVTCHINLLERIGKSWSMNCVLSTLRELIHNSKIYVASLLQYGLVYFITKSRNNKIKLSELHSSLAAYSLMDESTIAQQLVVDMVKSDIYSK